MTKPQQTSRLLRVLLDAKVDFVVIGGVAAVVHGSARMTLDLDIAMPFGRENLTRLIEALRPYGPVHATRPELSLLDESLDHLTTFRMLLIETDLGRVDAIHEVAPLGAFGSLDTVELQLFGMPCPLLSLEALIAVKESLARPKEVEVAHELKAIRDRRQQGDD